MDTPEPHAKHMARLRRLDRVIMTGGFTLMIAGLIYLAYLTLEVHLMAVRMAAMVGRF